MNAAISLILAIAAIGYAVHALEVRRTKGRVVNAQVAATTFSLLIAARLAAKTVGYGDWLFLAGGVMVIIVAAYEAHRIPSLPQ
jgi:hypothetical protein